MYFMFIMFVFLAAFGVSRYAILYPNKKQSWSTIGEIVFAPYFHIYGELFLDYPQENGKNDRTVLFDMFIEDELKEHV